MQFLLLVPDRLVHRMLVVSLLVAWCVGCAGSRLREKPIVLASSSFSARSSNSSSEPASSPGVFDKEYEGTCGTNEKVHSGSNQDAYCPSDCPYRLEVRPGGALLQQTTADRASDFCTFQCVATCDHPNLNPMTDVIDPEGMWCRPCIVEGCDVCADDGTDSCAKCDKGYYLDGKICKTSFTYLWHGTFCVAAVVVAFIVLWLVDLQFREATNMSTLDHCLKYRWSSRITPPSDERLAGLTPTDSVVRLASRIMDHHDATGLTPRNHHGARMWPLMTNLRKTDVAGPGVMLLMNFELFVLVWAVLVLVGWCIVSLLVDYHMLFYGTLKASTPRMFCILMLYGSEKKWATLWAKIIFILITYILTTLGCLMFALYQCRAFRVLGNEETTQSDYALLCAGLPVVKGSERVEVQWKEELTKALGVDIVGVSVCWDQQHKIEELVAVMDDKIEVMERRTEERSSLKDIGDDCDVNVPGKPWRKVLVPIEQKLLGIEDPVQKQLEGGIQPIPEMLADLDTTGFAFVVFATEEIRDEAMTKSQEGIQVGDNVVTFQTMDAEPDTVEWESFSASPRPLILSFLLAFGKIGVALLVWTVVFYLPYAYFLLSASYQFGAEQNMSEGLVTCMFLVGGNLVMYAICDVVARGVGFRFSDKRQACYVSFYFFAVFVNVVVDLAITYHLSFKIMAGRGVYTSNGTPIADLPTFYDRVASYPLQRELGNQLKIYAFPATFLVGFIVEPLAVYYVPYWLNKRFIRTHKGLNGVAAEKTLECPEFDMGRYADVLLNMTLASLVFFVPGGWTVILFGGLVVSHIYLYCYDSYRILRLSKRGDFASMQSETTVQILLSIPCGVLLTSLIFKADCYEDLPCSKEGLSLPMRIFLGWSMHMACHVSCVLWGIPKLVEGFQEHERAKEQYTDSAVLQPATWFSANLVNCLRSEHVYEHNPPCSYFIPGREHLMKANPAACSYFSAQPSLL